MPLLATAITLRGGIFLCFLTTGVYIQLLTF